MKPAQIIKTLTEIKRRRLMEVPNEEYHKVAYFLVEILILETGCIKDGSGDGHGFEEMFENAKNKIMFKGLEEEIYETPAYWESGRENYLRGLSEKVEQKIDEILENTYTIDEIVNMVGSKGELGTSNSHFLDGTVMYLLNFKDWFIDTLSKMEGPKVISTSVPQQLAILDKTGILDHLDKHDVTGGKLAQLVSTLLNRSKGNIKQYLHYGYHHGTGKPKGSNQLRFIYLNAQNEKYTDDLLKNIGYRI